MTSKRYMKHMQLIPFYRKNQRLREKMLCILPGQAPKAVSVNSPRKAS